MKRKIGVLENELEKNGTEILKLQAIEAVLIAEQNFARLTIND